MSATIKHTSLGEIEGNIVNGTAQFLGLKYASLKDRLASAELLSRYDSGVTNATEYGPPPVSPIGAVNSEFGFIQHPLPLPEVPAHSDIEGLNLNITLPLSRNGDINTSTKLPVYVFIHGGGFAVGSNWYPHYNPAPLVELSIEKGKPIIGITINYRLGITGFLTSEELRKAGYKANNGLHDQRTALRWIKKFIGGFGGDPDEVTVVGESAGAISVTLLLCSEEPLMKRCLGTGGHFLLFKQLSLSTAESAYQKVIEAFGLKDKSPEDRIQALLNVPIDDLWQKVPPGTPLTPAFDGDIIPGPGDFATISSKEDSPHFLMPGRKWCSALMLGDSKLDGNIYGYTVLNARKAGITQEFIASVNATLASQPETAALLLSLYNISPTTSDDDALLSILRFASEISFYAGTHAFARGWPNTKDSKFFLYHFNEGIPWPGPFQGEAGHILDVAYLFQNYNEHLAGEQKKVAKAFGEDFINFVNGEDPWPPVQGDQMRARVYGPSSEGVTTRYVQDGKPEHVGREERVLKLAELAGYDNIQEVFLNFFQR
ncbi:Alpha/Beta hydrolase protein [Pyrenochaeta sp. MPI-SDFR-AT-0127]|nr:Alpha/Beta hydrolase protein [Pyrenochaeta sp. MPI-SDFR-AT-0127]